MSNRNNYFKLEMLLLSVIYRQDCYGYDITKRIREGTNNLINIKEGVLYPILYKALENGYISRYEKTVGMKIRAYYHIEDAGKERLFEMIDEYHKLTDGINNLISQEVGDNNENN